MEKNQVTPKKKKKPSNFNRGPINPPKDWKDTSRLPASIFRVIPR